MTDQDPPVADDDFPEFSDPPRHKPSPSHSARTPREEEPETNEAQAAADDVIARLRKKRAEGAG